MVIVIIGILAGIGISTFKGYQAKARNIRTITAAKMYVDAAHRIITVEGKNAFDEGLPPRATGWDIACLGSDQCTWSGNGRRKPKIDALFSRHIDLKIVEAEMPSPHGNTYKGMAIVRGQNFTQGVYIEYMLESLNQDCKISPLLSGTPRSISHEAKYSDGNWGNSGNTVCVVPIILSD